MSTEDKGKLDMEALAAKINESVGEKLKGFQGAVDEKLSAVTQKIETMGARKTEEEVEDDADDLDDETVLTKKDALALFQKEIAKGTANVTEVVNKAINAVTTKQERDAETFQQYPMLNPQHPGYDKEFRTDVEAEIAKRSKLKGAAASEDPFLLIDSANAVFARNPKYQARKRSAIEEEQRRFNNTQGAFNTSRSRQTSAEPTQAQLDLAKRLGLSEENLRKSMAKTV